VIKPPLLELRDVRITVKDRVLIERVSMTVQPGELWCVLGRNGAGKTMLLQTMIGLRALEQGSVAMGGKALAHWRRNDAARFRAFLPQALRDAFPLTAIDAVLVARHPRMSRWRWESDDDRAVARAALDAVDLATMAQRDVLTLSGGERQRVAIATLIAQDAPLMLLDEPLAHLDVHHQLLVMRQLQALVSSGECGVILSLHDINLATRFASHAVLFRERAQVDVGPIAEVANASALSLAYGYPLSRVDAGGRVLFVAD
jgi:iron complex transport system ATP-binding protein